MFKKIVHWSGIVMSKVLAGYHKVETKVDADLPAIETLMEEGASVTRFLPGPIGTTVATALNLGVEMLGAADKTMHYTDDEFTKVKQQVTAALPDGSGLGVVLVPKQLEADFEEWFANVKGQVEVIKNDAFAITGKDGASAKQLPSAGPAASTPASVPPVNAKQ